MKRTEIKKSVLASTIAASVVLLTFGGGYILNNHKINEKVSFEEKFKNAQVAYMAEETAKLASADDIYITDVYSHLSLKEEPYTTAHSLADISPCTELEVISRTRNSMVYVRIMSGDYRGLTGYVNEEFITKKGENLKRAGTNDECFIISGVSEYLPLNSASFDGEEYELKKLYNGDAVLLLKDLDGDFCYVKDVKSGTVGYVKSKYLVKKNY